MNRRSAAFWLTILLCAALGSAAAQVHKDEVVYARLSATGTPLAMYIVNAFEADGPQEYTDYGRYRRVENLSSSAPLEHTEDAVRFAMDRGRFYYEGEPEARDLPWKIRFAYRLDGEDRDPGSLSGAAGRLEIRISVEPDPGEASFAEGMALQLNLTLDGDRCLNIRAEKATVAHAGGRRVISFQILSGLAADYLVTADVEDFRMDPPQAAGVRLSMDPAMIRGLAERSLKDSPLAAVAGGFLDGFVKEYSGAAPLSFADGRNGQIDRLQFVLAFDGIPEKTAEKEAEAAEEKENSGFWQRLAALFGG